MTTRRSRSCRSATRSSALSPTCISCSGVSMIFAESIDTVARDLLLVRPTLMTGVPRVFEKLEARIASVAKEHGRPQGGDLRLGVGRGPRARAARHREGRPRSAWLQLKSSIADRLVFRKIRGGDWRTPALLRVRQRAARRPARRVLLRGRAADPRGLRPHRDGAGVVCDAAASARDSGPSAHRCPNVELRIADDGEILARGPNVMWGYYNRPEETSRRARGRLVPHRRHRPARRGRLPADHRSQEGHDRHVGRQEDRAAADRERPAVARSRRRGRRRRRRPAFPVRAPRAGLEAARRQAASHPARRRRRRPRPSSRVPMRRRSSPRSSRPSTRSSRNSSGSRSSPFSRRSSRWTRASSRPRSRSNGA